MLESSSSFARTILDPAHVKDYDPVGIPDTHSGRTLCNKAVYTASLADVISGSSWYRINNDNAYSSAYPTDYESTTISQIYVIQDDNPFMPFYALTEASFDEKRTWGVYFFPNSQLEAVNDKSYRLMGRGMTIEQVGPYAERGGYCACYRLMNMTESDSTSDKVMRVTKISDIEANLIENMDGIRGVYSVLRPAIQQNLVQWKHYDQTVQYKLVDYSGVNIVNFTRPGVLYNDTAFSTNVVKIVPSSSLPLTDSKFNFRITASEAVEYESNTQIGNHVDAQPGVIAMVLAMAPHVPSFYPASYNDLRQMLGKIKQAYTKNKALVEAALDAITPERRSNIVKFLDQLAARV